MIREKWDSENNADVCAVLADGNKTFLKRTCVRILQEHDEQIFINRCPKCKRIVKTPIACLCLWCGHTWFELREKLQKIVQVKLENNGREQI